MHDDGVLAFDDGVYTLRFERTYPYSVERVWAALTERDQLSRWLADGDIGLETGQEFRLRWENTGDTLDSRIIRADAPHLLEFAWQFGDPPGSVVRWELSPVAAGTRFVLTHIGLKPVELPDTVSGWHAHLGILESLLNGESTAWEWERFNVLKSHYLEMLAERGISVTATETASTPAD